MSSSPPISVRGLGKAYRIDHGPDYDTLTQVVLHRLRHPFRRPDRETFWALRDVSFDVPRGQVVGIIGQNGAGKSTLLKLLTRITEPTEGEAFLRGRVGSLLEVGTGFHRELSGRENIYLNGSILGMTRREIRAHFDEIVAFAGTEKFLDTPVKRYSSGMFVRLAFAVAAHLRNDIMIVDEVLAVGDSEFQRKCLGKMGEVANAGRTVLFVSHNMDAVRTLCQRGILLEGGRVSFDGDAGQAVARYLDQHADQLTGEVDLANHPARHRSFQPLLSRLTLGDRDGIALWGQPLDIRIGYDFPDPIDRPEFVLGFVNSQGVRAFTLSSDCRHSSVPGQLQGQGEVHCRVPALPLMAGRYFVDVRIWQHGSLIDEVPQAAQLRVEWRDRHPAQVGWTERHGMVYLDAHWRAGGGSHDAADDARQQSAPTA